MAEFNIMTSLWGVEIRSPCSIYDSEILVAPAPVKHSAQPNFNLLRAIESRYSYLASAVCCNLCLPAEKKIQGEFN